MHATTMVPAGDGRVLAVCQWGPPDGSPVFWLHGTPGSRYLRHPGDQYERAGVRVLTYDRPGYGESSRAGGRTVSDSAADVTAIADFFGLERFGVAGVSGGGPPAFAVAALAPERVTRCAAIVCGPPLDAVGLDFFADLEDEDRVFWRQARDLGEEYLLGELEEGVAWLRSGMPGLESLPEDDRRMLHEAFSEAVRPGPWGYVDDFLAVVAGWGFAISDVVVPTRVMLAREDASVPPSHAAWWSQHLVDGEVVWVDGGHFGPRDEEEMELLAWVGGA
ncbi:alpha/beta fold hydrolase [Nocardioides ganghwensis]|uniref:Alpha/beta hydrolase n=1 Tax=Nocardioides ganghwensis TaxID=252230 RepID=A0A4V1RMZ4_9ACTN|nr:alpha/beta hydrolase [Nocardioides ganghwensis]MBD3946122.1 alpha/beta hydrolase [Nocardioides ganghwensis]RYC04067.1 alpha/beta hydrolase [Nocardioides ganghwensis]